MCHGDRKRRTVDIESTAVAGIANGVYLEEPVIAAVSDILHAERGGTGRHDRLAGSRQLELVAAALLYREGCGGIAGYAAIHLGSGDGGHLRAVHQNVARLAHSADGVYLEEIVISILRGKHHAEVGIADRHDGSLAVGGGKLILIGAFHREITHRIAHAALRLSVSTRTGVCASTRICAGTGIRHCRAGAAAGGRSAAAGIGIFLSNFNAYAKSI